MSTYLSPAACAKALSMTGEFIRGEIKDGRLKARKFMRASGRAVYRIATEDFSGYVTEYWPELQGSTKHNSQPSQYSKHTE